MVVCMYLCMYVCMYVYVCMHACMYVWYGMVWYVCMYIRILCMYVYIYINVTTWIKLKYFVTTWDNIHKLGARDAVVVAPPTAGAVVEALACAAYSIKMIWQCVKTLYPW